MPSRAQQSMDSEPALISLFNLSLQAQGPLYRIRQGDRLSEVTQALPSLNFHTSSYSGFCGFPIGHFTLKVFHTMVRMKLSKNIAKILLSRPGQALVQPPVIWSQLPKGI